MRDAQFLKLCQGLVPGWKSVTLSDVRFSVVSGGLTNQLTKVALRDDVSDLARRLKRVPFPSPVSLTLL